MVFSNSLFRESNRFKKLFISKEDVLPLECELNHFILSKIRCKLYFSLLDLHRTVFSNSLFRESNSFKKLFISKNDVLPLECELNHFIEITIRCRRLFQSIGPTQGVFSNSLFRGSNRFKKVFISKDEVLPLECELNQITIRCRRLFRSIGPTQDGFFKQ